MQYVTMSSSELGEMIDPSGHLVTFGHIPCMIEVRREEDGCARKRGIGPAHDADDVLGAIRLQGLIGVLDRDRHDYRIER